MESMKARLSSYKKSKRVKNPDKPSSTITLKWPHPSDFKANPEALAEAGFYFDPAYDDPDNVTCFMCQKELGGWEADDDPFLLHWRKCGQHCCWASVRCGLVTELDASGRFTTADKTRYPTHKTMEKARLDTYSAGKGWIHDNTKGHGANSSAMARAGFVYTPQQSGDDLATCLYCNTSLSGWDEDDDPMEEHRKRASKSDIPCPFFSTAETSRSQSTKPPSRSQARPPSRSTSKSQYQDMVLPTKTFDGEDDESDAVEQIKPSKTAAKTPRKPRSTSSTTKKSTTKTPAKSRSTSRSGLKGVAEVEGEEGDVEVEPPATVKKKSRSKSVIRSDIQTEEDENIEAGPPPTVKKKPRSRSKSVARQVIEVGVDDDEDNVNDIQMEPPPVVKKKSKAKPKSKMEADSEVPTEQEEVRKTSRSKSRKPTQQTEDETEEDALPPKSSRAKSKVPVAADNEEPTRKPSRSKPKSSVAPSMTEEVPRKTSRAKPKSKAADSELDEPVLSANARPTKPPPQSEEAPKPPVKPKHQRTASKSKAKATVAVSDTESVERDEPVTAVLPKKKASSKSKQPAPAEPVDPDELVTTAVPKKKKASSKPKPSPPVEAADLFNDNVLLEDTNPPPSPQPSSKPSTTPELAPLFVPKRPTISATSSKPPSQSKKPASKPKPTPATPKPMKVVEITSDDETDGHASEKENKLKDSSQENKENTRISASNSQSSLQPGIAQPQFKTPSQPISRSGKSGKIPIIVETVQPLETTRLPSPPPVEPEQNNGDVSMHDIELNEDHQMDDIPAPSTPPRPTIKFTPPNTVMPNMDSQPDLGQPSTPPKVSQNIPGAAKTPPFMPPLARLPFTPLHSLTDQELDMTVEEWIRYQMDVEFDKFRRDGERELQQFKKKAEEVRRVIEGL
ncbi:hypothetical protein BDN70DRAFT_880217 [Pholiota conissans]|uniref:Protein bir1 n=1 Tax=Pholiota conissans TaxID=109636 RepID=A0A9P6CZE5_9AGAR|nr:hypothetical protein BDN70DRAFT_880217 [Pholiota conissans]